MTTYAPKSEAIKAIHLKRDRINNDNTILFCPEIGFFDPEVSEGFYGIPIYAMEGGHTMLWGNPGDWLIKSNRGFKFVSNEDFREKYYRLAYSDPPGEI